MAINFPPILVDEPKIAEYSDATSTEVDHEIRNWKNSREA